MKKNPTYFLTREEINKRNKNLNDLVNLVEQEFLKQNPEEVKRKAMAKKRGKQIRELLHLIENQLTDTDQTNEEIFCLGSNEANPYLFKISKAMAMAYKNDGHKAEVEKFNGGGDPVILHLTLR